MSSSQTIEEPNNNFKIELFIEDIDNGDLEILKTLINNIKNNNNHSKKKKKISLWRSIKMAFLLLID